jgi:two-component system, chemotaxis family, chemotaxis protein CheY
MSLKNIPISVLVIDDNHHMRSLIKELLKAIGISEVREASEPVEAMEMMRTTVPDILLVDFSMPMIDGVEFVQMIRTGDDSPNPFIPIIMITGHSERSKVMQARDAGVNEFLVKPINAKSLMVRLQAVVENPRPFVKVNGYFGPDRRRGQNPKHDGPWRRKDDDKKGQ